MNETGSQETASASQGDSQEDSQDFEKEIGDISQSEPSQSRAPPPIPPPKVIHNILILAPVNTLHNWMIEYDRWVPPELKRKVNVCLLSAADDAGKQQATKRLEKIQKWSNMGGVLVMGYDLFRTLTTDKLYYQNKYGGKAKGDLAFQQVRSCLLNPGTFEMSLMDFFLLVFLVFLIFSFVILAIM
jgi:hypothetical protein